MFLPSSRKRRVKASHQASGNLAAHWVRKKKTGGGDRNNSRERKKKKKTTSRRKRKFARWEVLVLGEKCEKGPSKVKNHVTANVGPFRAKTLTAVGQAYGRGDLPFGKQKKEEKSDRVEKGKFVYQANPTGKKGGGKRRKSKWEA